MNTQNSFEKKYNRMENYNMFGGGVFNTNWPIGFNVLLGWRDGASVSQRTEIPNISIVKQK